MCAHASRGDADSHPGSQTHTEESHQQAARTGRPMLTDTYRLALRQPASTASCSVQNQRSPLPSSMMVSSYERPPGTW